MKIIQITDTHLMPRGTELHGLNPCERLEACIASIKEFHADAEMCIITGDLTDQGLRESYEDIREILQQLPMPFHPLIGNHDHRKIFSEVFPEVPLDKHGFVQQMLETPIGRFLLLDTVELEKIGDLIVKNEVHGYGLSWKKPEVKRFIFLCTILHLTLVFQLWIGSVSGKTPNGFKK